MICSLCVCVCVGMDMDIMNASQESSKEGL